MLSVPVSLFLVHLNIFLMLYILSNMTSVFSSNSFEARNVAVVGFYLCQTCQKTKKSCLKIWLVVQQLPHDRPAWWVMDSRNEWDEGMWLHPRAPGQARAVHSHSGHWGWALGWLQRDFPQAWRAPGGELWQQSKETSTSSCRMSRSWGDKVRARKWDVSPSPGKEVQPLIHLSTFTVEDRYHSSFLEIVF